MKRIIPRISITNDDLIACGKIDIQFYKPQCNFMEMVRFRKMAEPADTHDSFQALDFLLKVARPLKPNLPSWSGAMQLVNSGQYQEQSSVVLMPMIDLNPSDMSCVYSTLKFVVEQSERVNAFPIVTFDQPLYWKSLTILTNKPNGSDLKGLIVRLGAFHTEMSFLGNIGRIMENTGLAEILATVYATNTVGHMLSGKAQCSSGALIGKRQVNVAVDKEARENDLSNGLNVRASDIVVCDSCCDTPWCQTALCQDIGFSQNRGPICFQCNHKSLADKCTHVTTCGRDEVCYQAYEFTSTSHHYLEKQGCYDTSACNNIGAIRGNNTCWKCCGDDLCNDGCRSGAATATTTSNPVTTPCVDLTASNTCRLAASIFCQDVNHAREGGCMHYCGYC